MCRLAIWASVRGPWRAAAAPGMSWWSRGTWPRQQSSRVLRGRGVWCRGRARVRHKERMPMPSPYQVVLSGEEQAVLAARARSVRSEHRDRLRAAIVLAAAAGQANAAIARELGVCTDTVRKWRRRFAASRLAGLADAPRSGRPPVFTATDRAEVIALACALPAESECRCRGGAVRTWPASWPPAASSRSRRLPSAGGWPAMPSSPGSTGPGSCPRPGVRRQGRPGAGSLCRDLRWPPAGRE